MNIQTIMNAYDNLTENENFKKIGLTLADISTIYWCIYELTKTHKSACIQSNIANWFSKLGAEITPQGVGYGITIKP